MDTVVVAALIAAAPPTLAVAAKWRYDATKGAKREKKIDDVHDEVRTNHGKKNGEYIEQLVSGQAIQSALLVTHTRQDDERFAELKALLLAQNAESHLPS